MTARPDSEYFDDILRRTLERIDRHGYTVTIVGTGECEVPGCDCSADPYPYAYSIGLCEHDHPELVVFGLDLWHVNAAMDPIVAAARAGAPLAVGREHRHVFADVHEYCLVPVPELWVRRDPGRIGGWIDVYRSALPPFLQICWADQQGAMPFDDDCDPSVRDRQPILAVDPLRYPKPPRTSGRHRRRG